MINYISTLIDNNTVPKKTLSHDGKKFVRSGYIVFIVNDKMVSRSIQYCNKLHQQYIVYKNIQYYLNIPCKPISGAFSKEALLVQI